MKWKGRRESTNVEDSRGRRVAGTAGAGMLLNLVGRKFGIKGILVMLVVVGVLWMTGLVDPAMFLGGETTSQSEPYQADAGRAGAFRFRQGGAGRHRGRLDSGVRPARRDLSGPDPGDLHRPDQHRLRRRHGADGAVLLPG